jgi:intein-encoded DNA endonuclease-like protein
MTWEYIAGFFDGEGSIVYNGSGFRITIAQTNLAVLDNIKRFAKVGQVIKVTKRQSHWKDSWVYYISKQEDILFFVRHIQNFSIVKKQKINIVLPRLINAVSNNKDRILKRQLLTKSAKALRKKGLSYREIGKRLDIDFGHARRLIKK